MLDWSLGARLDRYAGVSLYAAHHGGDRGLAWVGRATPFRDRANALAAAEIPGLVRTSVHERNGRTVRLDAEPDGVGLEKLLAERGFTEPELLRIGQRLAHTLASMHAVGLSHGAISLRTVSLSGGPRRWLPMLGSPAPVDGLGDRRALAVPGAGRSITPAEDVFALGYVLASLVYGHTPPHSAPSWGSSQPGPVVRLAHMLADDQAGIVLERAIERSPDRRPSARWLADRLHAVLTAPPVRRTVH